MSDAEKLLDSLTEVVHEHDVVDTDVRFTIDPFSRTISSSNGQKTILIQGDHKSERFTFEIPRYIEGHDMLLCDVVRIPYINSEVDGRTPRYNVDVHTVGDLQIDPTNDKQLIFSWKVSDSGTMYEGTLVFSVVFLCLKGKRVTYRFGTDTYENMFVRKTPEIESTFELRHLDIIEQWKEKVRTEFTEYIDIEVDKHIDVAREALREELTNDIDEAASLLNERVTNFTREVDVALTAFDDILETEITTMGNNIDVLESRMDTFTALKEGSTTGDAELADASINSNGVKFDNVGDVIRTQNTQVNSILDKIVVENIYDPSVQTSDTVTNNAFIQAGKEVTHDNYFITGPIDVSRFRGKRLYFNKLLYGSAVEAARVSSFDSNGEYLTHEGLNGLEYVVPANASYIKLTVYKDVHATITGVNNNFMILTSNISTSFFPYGYKFLQPMPSYEDAMKMVVNVKNNVVNITAPSGSGYLHYVLKYFANSNNAFFDFDKIGFTLERSASPNNEQIVFSNGSDFFGPYIVKAIQNIDGDMPDSLNFTGASHAYSGNTEWRTSATGSSHVDCVLVDGKKYSEYDGYCNTIDVYWTNYIQATNTKKEDGTGRSVLKEQYHLHFDGYAFEVENDITALEDVRIVRYYGLQIGQGVSGSSYEVSYIGSHNNIPSNNGNTNSSDNHCSEIHIKRKDLPAECRFGIHPIGLGSFYYNPSYSAFDTDYGKTYFYMINPDKACDLVDKQQLNFKGYYKFRYCE